MTGMAVVENLTEYSDPALLEAARDLFGSYGATLNRLGACQGFNFSAFEDEICHLPAAYTSANGEVLLALNAPSHPVGSVAFRAAPPTAETMACEIKRLFVFPEHRGKGLAELLIQTALHHARVRGYSTAILDTEPSTMQAAEALYRKLGFTPYTPTRPHNPIKVIYFRRSLL